jgi:SOS-response transcriptional repressor LexA
MVIKIPGLQIPGTQARRNSQEIGGPQPGPDPAWARFARTAPAQPGAPGSISLQAFKPEITGYRVLGRETQSPESKSSTMRVPERNSHNSSVYVAPLGISASRQSKMTRLPVAGEIAAGQYDVTVAFQEYDCLDNEGGVVVDQSLARGGAYALRVRGTSMTHVGIDPGDIVIVRPQEWANDGDFVVANFTEGAAGGSEGLATLKRFYKRRDHIFLQSATASTEPIRLYPSRRNGAPDSDTVKVQGVVTVILKAR